MKYITNLIAKILQKELPKPMGRWNIDYCNKKMNTKIDLSNEDHCGPCGQYIKTKIDLQNKSKVPFIKD
jgi:hypothetical protein